MPQCHVLQCVPLTWKLGRNYNPALSWQRKVLQTTGTETTYYDLFSAKLYIHLQQSGLQSTVVPAEEVCMIL